MWVHTKFIFSKEKEKLCKKINIFNYLKKKDNIIIMVEYKCSRCSKIFTKKYNFEKHQNRKYPCKKVNFKCTFCNKIYSTKSNLNKHMKKCDNNNKVTKSGELEIMKEKIDYLMKQKKNL